MIVLAAANMSRQSSPTGTKQPAFFNATIDATIDAAIDATIDEEGKEDDHS
jgi:hypothetical protein